MNAARAIDFAGTVRPLRAADLPSIQRILELWVRDTSSSPPLMDEIAGHLASMSNSLVDECEYRYLVAATEKEEVVGVIGLRPIDLKMLPFVSTERPAELINVYVEEHYRKGRGVGTVLVRELERLARESGHTEIAVNSGPRYRASGWPFFDKIGYERRGLARDFYGKGVHAPVWRKIL